MSSPDSRPSGGTVFEQELVNAMNDFVNAAETPSFDTATIKRGARRKRVTAIAGLATALVVAGGVGTALAATGGSHRSTPVRTAAATDSTTVLIRTSSDRIVKEQLAGATSRRARAELTRYRITPSFTRVKKADCKTPQDVVVAVSPHAPKVVRPGETVVVTTCFR